MGKKFPVKSYRENALSFYATKNIIFNLLLKLFDYLIVPLCILTLAFDPNFLHGIVNHFESGHYLSVLNGIFEGKIPYKDFFVLFGPLQLYVIAFAMILFGKSLSVLMSYFYANYLLNLLVIYFLGRAVCKNRFFICLIPFICLLEVTHPFWAARYDYGRTGLGILALLLLINFLKKKNSRLLFFIGSVSCIILLYSIDIGVFTIISSIFFFAGLALAQKDNLLKGKLLFFLRISARYSIGALIVFIAFLLFLSLNGALFAFIETTSGIIKYHMKVWGQHIPPFEDALKDGGGILLLIKNMVFKLYLPITLYTATFLYLVISFVKKRWDEDKAIILLLFIYGVLVYKASFRAITGPQFQVALPPLIILTVLFLEKSANVLFAIYSQFKKTGLLKKYELFKVISIALFFVIFFSYILISPKRYYGTFGGWINYQSTKKYLTVTDMHPLPINKIKLVKSNIKKIGVSMIPDWQASTMESTVAYLKNNTRIGEEVFCFPEESLYNFLADRPAFSRFYIAAYAWSNPKWRLELLNEFITKKPRIVLSSNLLSNMAECAGRSKELFPEIRKLIANKYHVVAKFYDIIIYERNEQIKESGLLRNP